MQEEFIVAFHLNVCCLSSLCGNTDDARDLLQEGFINSLQEFVSLQAEGSFEGWIRRVFINTSIEQFRKKSARLSTVTERRE